MLTRPLNSTFAHKEEVLKLHVVSKTLKIVAMLFATAFSIQGSLYLFFQLTQFSKAPEVLPGIIMTAIPFILLGIYLIPYHKIVEKNSFVWAYSIFCILPILFVIYSTSALWKVAVAFCILSIAPIGLYFYIKGESGANQRLYSDAREPAARR